MHERIYSCWSRAAAIVVVVVLGGCASPVSVPVSDVRSSAERAESGAVERALYEQLARWRGTRYRLGGQGAKGIDCSGLTQAVYRDVFGKSLPRTTEGQENVGHPVKRRSLAPGDLVFFKTGLLQRHVGIYVEDGMFLHASRSGGVRLSNLQNGYWDGRYWKARRLPAARVSASRTD